MINKQNIKKIKLKPKNASACILLNNGKILLQKRDFKKNIFYPGYHGFFGGAKEKNETYLSCIKREINEELGINIKKKRFKFFSKNSLDFSPIKEKIFFRYYYVLKLNNKEVKKIKIKEGIALKKIEIKKVINSNLKIVPYDAFVLWLFFYRRKY